MTYAGYASKAYLQYSDGYFTHFKAIQYFKLSIALIVKKFNQTKDTNIGIVNCFAVIFEESLESKIRQKTNIRTRKQPIQM